VISFSKTSFTFAPWTLKYGRVDAVTVAVTSAVNMDIIFMPVIIQMKQNSRPGRDFGELSP